MADFKNDIQILLNAYSKAVIGTDLNARHTFWGCSSNNGAGDVLFHELMGNTVDVHFSPDPTHYPHDGSTPSTIDIILTNGINLSSVRLIMSP